MCWWVRVVGHALVDLRRVGATNMAKPLVGQQSTKINVQPRASDAVLPCRAAIVTSDPDLRVRPGPHARHRGPRPACRALLMLVALHGSKACERPALMRALDYRVSRRRIMVRWRPADAGLGGGGGAFVVAGQAAVASGPGEAAWHGEGPTGRGPRQPPAAGGCG